MDLVNSVTQNSNNRKVTMENQGEGEAGDGNHGDSSSWRNFSADSEPTDKRLERHCEPPDGTAPESQQQMSEIPSESALAPSSAGQSGAAAGAPMRNDESKYQVPDYLRAIGMDPRKFWPKKYRFTREKPPGQHNTLTIAQRNFYEANGYIVLDDCASKRLLDAIRGQHKEQGTGDFDNEFLLDKLLLKNEKLLQYVKCFCDERLMLMTHRLVDNFQPAEGPNQLRDLIDNRHQQRQPLFRDWMYLPFRPIDKVCCAITAIEPLEHVLLVVPGTHRIGQCSISSMPDDASAAYEPSQEKRWQRREIFECSPERLSTLVEKSKKGFKYINLKPGQTLFYHPGLVHGFSQDLINFRRSQLASIAYYAAADCEYIDLRKSSSDLVRNQPIDNDANRPLVPISLAHFGPDKNPMDYNSWLDRPRLVGNNKL